MVSIITGEENKHNMRARTERLSKGTCIAKYTEPTSTTIRSTVRQFLTRSLNNEGSPCLCPIIAMNAADTVAVTMHMHWQRILFQLSILFSIARGHEHPARTRN